MKKTLPMRPHRLSYFILLLSSVHISRFCLADSPSTPKAVSVKKVPLQNYKHGGHISVVVVECEGQVVSFGARPTYSSRSTPPPPESATLLRNGEMPGNIGLRNGTHTEIYYQLQAQDNFPDFIKPWGGKPLAGGISTTPLTPSQKIFMVKTNSGTNNHWYPLGHPDCGSDMLPKEKLSVFLGELRKQYPECHFIPLPKGVSPEQFVNVCRPAGTTEASRNGAPSLEIQMGAPTGTSTSTSSTQKFSKFGKGGTPHNRYMAAAVGKLLFLVNIYQAEMPGLEVMESIEAGNEPSLTGCSGVDGSLTVAAGIFMPGVSDLRGLYNAKQANIALQQREAWRKQFLKDTESSLPAEGQLACPPSAPPVDQEVDELMLRIIKNGGWYGGR